MPLYCNAAAASREGKGALHPNTQKLIR